MSRKVNLEEDEQVLLKKDSLTSCTFPNIENKFVIGEKGETGIKSLILIDIENTVYTPALPYIYSINHHLDRNLTKAKMLGNLNKFLLVM